MNDLIDIFIIGPDTYILIIAFAIITFPLIFVLYARFYEGKPIRRFDRLMKNPQFLNEQKGKIKFCGQTDTLLLPCSSSLIYERNDEQWLISKNSIQILNCRIKKTNVKHSFSTTSLSFVDIRKNWYWGDMGVIYLWFDDYEAVPKWKKLPIIRSVTSDRIFYFKPVARDAALEFKRRHEEYIANQSKQNQS